MLLLRLLGGLILIAFAFFTMRWIFRSNKADGFFSFRKRNENSKELLHKVQESKQAVTDRKQTLAKDITNLNKEIDTLES